MLSSPVNILSYRFEIKPGISLTAPCSIEINYLVSEMLLAEQSYITVSLNGFALSSRRLDSRQPGTMPWNLSLPPNQIKRGWNEIKLVSRQRTTEGPCKDIDNDANWMKLLRSSRLQLTAKKFNFNPLAFFPFPYFDYLSSSPAKGRFVLPPQPKNSEIETMLYLAADWGRQTPWQPFSVPVSIFSSAESSRNLVLIGEADHWQNLVSREVAPGQGLIKKLPQSDSILITGKDAEGLKKACRTVTSPVIMSQVKSNLLVINSLPPEEKATPLSNRPGLFSFAQLGMDNVNIMGPFNQRYHFTLYRPINWNIGKRSYLKLHYKHAAGIDPARSVMTVFINGQPAGSLRLNLNEKETGTLKFGIPASEIEKNVWQVEIGCYHELGSLDCSKYYDLVAWTVIYNDSEVYFAPGEIYRKPSLDAFPYFATVSGQPPREVTVWLPSKPSRAELSAAAALAAHAGRNNRYSINWKVVTSDTLVPELASAEAAIVIIESNENNRWIPLCKNITAWYDPTLKQYFSRGIKMISDVLDRPTFIESVPSPWNKQGTLYLLAAQNDAALENAVKSLSKKEIVNRLQDQIYISSDNRAPLILKADFPQEDEVPTAKGNIQVVSIIAGIAVIILITVFIANRKRSRPKNIK